MSLVKHTDLKYLVLVNYGNAGGDQRNMDVNISWPGDSYTDRFQPSHFSAHRTHVTQGMKRITQEIGMYCILCEVRSNNITLLLSYYLDRLDYIFLDLLILRFFFSYNTSYCFIFCGFIQNCIIFSVILNNIMTYCFVS